MKGRATYHEIWEKYFTLPWELKPVDVKNRTPIDQFLFEVNYSKADKKTIRNKIKNCETASDYTEELSNIFNFQISDILNAEKLAEVVKSSKESINFKYAIEFIFRGYIVLSKMLPELIAHDIDQIDNPLLNSDSWNSIYLIYESLLIQSSSQEIIDDFFESINPIFDAYSKFSDKIMSLPNINYVKYSLVRFIESIVPSLSAKTTFSIEKVVNFINKIFDVWIKSIEKLELNDPFYNAYNFHYVQKIVPLVHIFNEQQLEQISRIISHFLSFYTDIEKKEYFISHGISNLQLLSTIVDKLKTDSHCQGLFEFTLYSITNYFDANKINDKPRSYISNDDLLSYFMPEKYIKTHEIIDLEKISFQINMIYIKNIISLFQTILSKTRFTNEIISHIIYKANNLDLEQIKQFYLIFISALSNLTDLESDVLYSIFKVYSNFNIFTIPQDDLHQLLLDNTFAYLFKSIVANNKNCELLFSNLFEVCSTNFESILVFMPLLRSVLRDNYVNHKSYFIMYLLKQDSFCNYVHMNMNNMKYCHQIDEMIVFIQVTAVIFPSDIFTSGLMFPIIFGFVSNERYGSIALSWFKYTFDSFTQSNTDSKLFQNLILIISVILEKTLNEESTKYLKELSSNFMKVLNETVLRFSIDVALMFSDLNLLMSFASLPQVTHDISTLKNVTSFLFNLDIKANHKIESLNTIGSIVFSCLRDSFKGFELDLELVEILLSQSMREKVRLQFTNHVPTIQNRIALKLLIDVVKDTQFEGIILDDLIKLCNQSTSNTFECFHNEIINYTLERALKKKLRVKAIQLYQIVSSTFFSPLSLYQTFKALYCTSLNKRSNYHQMILDCFLRLILENRPNPVSRFFHFNGIKTGIVKPCINSNLTQNWSFITTLRMDTPTSLEDPLLCLCDDLNVYYLFSFVHEELVFSCNSFNNSINIEPKSSSSGPISSAFVNDDLDSLIPPNNCTFTFRPPKKKSYRPNKFDVLHLPFPNFKFTRHVWYQILIIFTSREILLFVNGSQVSSIKLKKCQQLNGNVLVRIGNFQDFSFSGDLGPIFFLKNPSNVVSSEYIEQMINEYQKSVDSSTIQLHSILCYDPYNSNDIEISDVIPNEESAILRGSSVQFCSTLSSVLRNCGTFQCFLPLFSIVDHPCIDDSNESNQLHNSSSDNGDEMPVQLRRNSRMSRRYSANDSFGIINLEDDDENEDKNSSENKSVDDQIFHTLLVILKMLLEISPEMEKNFESIGGFQLLAGLFSPFTPESFTIYVPHDMEEIYCSLKSESLKHQMVEFIWLNFDLWSTFSQQVQKRFYEFELKQAFSVDPKPFDFSTYDFLLYQIQSNQNVKHEEMNLKLNGNSHLVENEDELKRIKESQWDFFSKVYKPNTGTLWFIFFILSYNESAECRNNAFKIFNKLLVERNNVMLDSLIILNRIDNYLLLVDKSNPNNLLYFMYLLGKLQKEDKNSLKFLFEFKKATFAVTKMIDFEKADSVHLFNDCSIYSLNNNGGFNCTEFIPLLTLFSIHADKNDVKNVYSKFSLSVQTDFPTINKFINDTRSWPFYFFVLSNSADNFVKLFTDTISKSPKNFGLLVNFLLFIQLSLKIDMFSPLVKLLLSILTRYSDFNLVSIILKLVLFTIKVDSDDQLKPFEKLTSEEIFNLQKSLESLTIPVLKVEFEPSFDDQLYKVLGEIFLVQFPNEKFSFLPDFSLGSFVIYSYLTSIRIEKTKNYSLFIEYLNKKKEFIQESLINQSIIDISQSLMDITYLKVKELDDFIRFNVDLNYEEKVNDRLNKAQANADYNYFTQKLKEYSKVYDIAQFIDDVTSISSSLNDAVNIVKNIDSKANDQFHDAYEKTLQNHHHVRNIVEQYNIKLAQSFIRESTSNGGPLSTTPPESVKWRWVTRTDSLFRPSLYRVNLSFTTHSKAARIRDESLKKMKINADSENKIIPFKRILDQKVSLNQISNSTSSSISSGSKVIASFNVINLNVSIRYFGRLNIIDDKVFFEGSALSDGFGTPFNKSGNIGDKNSIYDEQSQKTKFIEIPLETLEFVFVRAFLYEDNSCEIFTNLNKSYFFIFNSTENRNDFMSAVKRELDDTSATHMFKTYLSQKIRRLQPTNFKEGKFYFFESCRKATGSHVQDISSQEMVSKSGIVEAWQNRQISNFMYLFLLNILAGRSLNDLSKYPVFPWIFADYTSEKIDLNDPTVYRKLDVPLGAYSEDRLRLIRDFQQDLVEQTEFCLYRTHYSSAAFVIGYLVRTEPFATLHIILQGGMFDHSDRLFSSISNTWNSVSSQMNDYRELIPQFFCDPHFLVNENEFDLGRTMNGKDVSNVSLPNWANSSAYKFIEIQRAGIESEYVSSNIHHWIDLIFGVYQKSFEKNNLFHMFSYPDCLSSPLIKEDYQVTMAKYHGINFGTCCDQIFSQNHPARNPLNLSIRKPLNFTKVGKMNQFSASDIYYFDNRCLLLKSGFLFIFSMTPKIVNLQFQLKERKFYSIISMSKPHKLLFLVTRGGTFMSVISYKNCISSNGQATETKRVSHFGSSILCLDVVGRRCVLTGGSDCSIHIWSLPNMDLIGRMSVQSRSVHSISCCQEIDLIASMDESHQVWCSSVDSQKFINTFQITCPEGSTHEILSTKNGFLFISTCCRYCAQPAQIKKKSAVVDGIEEEEEDLSDSIPLKKLNEKVDNNKKGIYCVDVFDIRGNFIKKIEFPAPVVKMKELYLNSSMSFVVLSLENMSLQIVRTADLEIFDSITSCKVMPELFSVDSSRKTVFFISQSDDPDMLKSYTISI